MKFAVTSAWIGIALCTGGVPLLAQFKDNSEKHLTCENGGYDSDRARHCEMREQTLPSIGKLTLDASPNGGVTIKGSSRGDVLVRARIEGYAENQSAAEGIVRQVWIDGSGGQVRATGPQRGNSNNNNTGWSVSYEVFVPQATDLDLKTINGGIVVQDVRGQIRFAAKNGGIDMKRVGGDVSGETVNGGIQVEMAGTMFNGRQMELTTKNGGVTLALPSSYSAHIQAETAMGGIRSDFPVNVDNNNPRSHRVDFNLGAGGPLIKITTTNGAVHVKKTEAM